MRRFTCQQQGQWPIPLSQPLRLRGQVLSLSFTLTLLGQISLLLGQLTLLIGHVASGDGGGAPGYGCALRSDSLFGAALDWRLAPPATTASKRAIKPAPASR